MMWLNDVFNEAIEPKDFVEFHKLKKTRKRAVRRKKTAHRKARYMPKSHMVCIEGEEKASYRRVVRSKIKSDLRRAEKVCSEELLDEQFCKPYRCYDIPMTSRYRAS